MQKILISFTITLFLFEPLLAVYGTGMGIGLSSAGPTVQSVTSTTNKIFGTSTRVSSTGRRRRGSIFNQIFGQLTAPKLIEKARPGQNIKSFKYHHDIPSHQREWLEHQFNAFAVHWNIMQSPTLDIHFKNLRRFERRGTSIYFNGQSLYLKPGWVDSQNSRELHTALGLYLWDQLEPQQQDLWKVVGGWTHHPLLPFIETQKGATAGFERENTQDSSFDFALSIALKLEKKDNPPSKQVFLNQLAGYQNSENLEFLDDLSIHYAYIQAKGMLGSSQGHCALVLDIQSERATFAYLSEFNHQKPYSSMMKSLLGLAQREIHTSFFDEFQKNYQNNQRAIDLYDLQFTRDEKLRLLYRIKESILHEEGQYSFLRQNCAGPLKDLLRYAKPKDSELNRYHTPKSLRRWASSIKEHG